MHKLNCLSHAIYIVLFTGLSTSAWAEEITQSDVATSSNILPTISLQADSNQKKYAATQASSALKSDAPLFKTPQSVSVITREQLDQKQATTLSQAINGVAGSVWLFRA